MENLSKVVCTPLSLNVSILCSAAAVQTVFRFGPGTMKHATTPAVTVYKEFSWHRHCFSQSLHERKLNGVWMPGYCSTSSYLLICKASIQNMANLKTKYDGFPTYCKSTEIYCIFASNVINLWENKAKNWWVGYYITNPMITVSNWMIHYILKLESPSAITLCIHIYQTNSYHLLLFCRSLSENLISDISFITYTHNQYLTI